MSRQLDELESVLQLLIEEHKRMLSHIDTQQAAMKALMLDAMEDATHRQEASRLRIAALENRRRLLVREIARIMRLPGEPTISQLAEKHPAKASTLLKLREELRALAQHVADRSHVAGRLAVAILGHLNTAVRLIAGAVEHAGVYTKHGVPRVSARIGAMEAVA